MAAVVGLSAFNLVVLLWSPRALGDVLELMTLPSMARLTLLAAVAINVGLALAFERWGTQAVAVSLEWAEHHIRRGRRKTRDGKTYKPLSEP
jgi:cation-transporting ATPase 13A2